jgi:twitching motility two-component system response regulator PilH
MAGKKILVVDDSPTQLKLTTVALQGQGYEILTAMDGEEAMEKVHADKPDLVVLDVVMPRMDGFQVCRKMKASAEMQHIPVIMLTSKNQKADEFWGKKQGADMYLTKPFDKIKLQDAVTKGLVRG